MRCSIAALGFAILEWKGGGDARHLRRKTRDDREARGDPAEIAERDQLDQRRVRHLLQSGDDHQQRGGEADPAANRDDIRGQAEQRADRRGGEQTDGENPRAGDGVGDEDMFEVADRHSDSPFDPPQLDPGVNGVDYA